MVVAIVGVLVSMALVTIKSPVRPIDVATRVGDLVREANRRAVALGPLRARVAASMGTKARTRVRGIASGPQPTLVLERFQEVSEDAAEWVAVLQYIVPRQVIAESWAAGVGGHVALPRSTEWIGFEARCYPDGTCDPRTLFFEATVPGAESERYARMSIMPIGGAIMTRRDWN